MANQVLVSGRHYRVGHTLGSGGQATVRYLDPVEAGSEPLAQKVFNRLSAFRTEVRALQRVSEGGRHDNLVHMIESDEPTLRIVMPFVAGGTLRQLIERVRLPENQIAFVLQGILTGVEALHSLRIIHGDLKPENILLRSDGAPVITDYGLSLELGEAMDGHGTKGFKSPETVEAEMQRALGEGGKPVTHKVDTFALPLIAIQCVLDGESLYSKEPTAGEIGLENAPPAQRAHYIFNRLRTMFVSLQKAPPRLATFAGDTLTLLGQRALTASNMKKHTFIHNQAKHGRAGFTEAIQLTTKLNEKKALQAKLADAEQDIEDIQERLRRDGTLREKQPKSRFQASSDGRIASDVRSKHDAFNSALKAPKDNHLKSKKHASSSSPAVRDRLPTSMMRSTNDAGRQTKNAQKLVPAYSSSSTDSRQLQTAAKPDATTAVSRQTTKGNKAAPYKCPHTDCPKKATTFTRKFEYDDHMKAHSGAYDCKPCGQRLWSSRAWNQHMGLPKHTDDVANSKAKKN